MSQVRRSVLVTLAIAAIACGPLRPGAQSGPSGPFEVRVVSAGNGSLSVATSRDAGCTAQAHLRSGDPVYIPSPTQIADAEGHVAWSFPGFGVPADDELQYEVTCAIVGATASATSAPIEILATASPAVAATTARYGTLDLRAPPHAACDVAVKVPLAALGDGPPTSLRATVGAAGTMTLSYATPPVPAGAGMYDIACSTGSATARSSVAFEVAERKLSAAAFTVRVVASAPPPGDLRATEIAGLIPLRDRAVTRIHETLASEWRAATRGLGNLQIVEANADMLVKVIAASDVSVHVSAPDGSQEIRIFVADPRYGANAIENLVAVALHELGHIWCCTGLGSGDDGHWLTATPDAELTGVDRFGLMNHPVRCLVFGVVWSCPNRFSRRELETFGFVNIPPPPPDPCIARQGILRSQLASMDTQLLALRDRIRALEAAYPAGLPPAPYAEYGAAISRYNALVDQRNPIAQQLNGLLC